MKAGLEDVLSYLSCRLMYLRDDYKRAGSNAVAIAELELLVKWIDGELEKP